MKYRFKILETISEEEKKTKNGKKIEIIEVERDFPIEKLIELCIDLHMDSESYLKSGIKIKILTYLEEWLEKCS